ncbi:MAG: glycosyl hydrolase [Melioribacteraceae bacterium]|nr:glycosyl hydrolase [Melioribacteraceae bacterium]
MKFKLLFCLLIIVIFSFNVRAEENEEKKKDDPMSSATFSGLKFRNIGPAFTSGRIADFAVNPKNNSEYYVGVASGNIWKTVNNGTTWEPVFDKYGSYSIGCLAMDPNNSNVVWVGTGENNHQRALGYGDGVYKTTDGGKSWKNMGLKESRQIGKIVVDPRNSKIVFVAAEGSAWGEGGDRGLYKTIDDGKTWKKVLEISKHTGVNNLVFDPRDPDVMYATSEQRRRHVHTKIGGGPESAVYKSDDGGETWFKIMSGLPKVNIGGMGIDISPVNPDILYLIVEAAEDKSGFFRSVNRGASWEKMSDHAASGQYYNEIYCDPKDADKVYSVETYSHFTEDGGKTWKRLSNKGRHVDDHALWIDPCNTKHFMIGGDGGIYESYDAGENYLFKCNLPVTQFYRVSVDNEYPFYNVYGGTQDNNSMGGPSRTLRSSGILNSDWFTTNGGDGFWGAADPSDPNIVYAESQYGNMVRYDRKSGEAISIRPEPRKGELTYKWNWNTPLIISPHSNTRLYCAANKVFRSDDRGNTWQVISEDITAQINRNTWPVMDKYWSVDAVKKDVSTSQFGTSVSFDESPVKENLLYVGTDDGVIQVSEDAKTWTKIDEFPEVPKHTYISDIMTSKYDENIVYVSFDNRKRDDFKPYILVSKDKGKNWETISSDLPVNGTVHTIAQDHVNPELLFVGTEFGIFFTPNAGEKWIQLKSGIPTTAIRDITIQERENDLVLATFGRGFYILDDYTPLREVSDNLLKKDTHIFPVKEALMYVEQRSRYGQGSTFYAAKNPEFGATFTYYLKEVPKTKKQIRKKSEKDLFKDGKKIPQPAYEDLVAENKETKPYLVFTITDSKNEFVKRITKSAGKGINRAVWDLRYQGTSPVKVKNGKYNPLSKPQNGMLAMPGKYKVAISMFYNDEFKQLTGPAEFSAKLLNNSTLPAADISKLVEFQNKVAELSRTVRGTQEFAEELVNRVEHIKLSLHNTPSVSAELIKKADALGNRLDDILFKFIGKKAVASAEEVPPSAVTFNSRLGEMMWTHWRSTSGITGTEKMHYEILLEEFPPVLEDLKNLYNKDLKEIETEMEKIKAPWTPGRVPNWIN